MGLPNSEQREIDILGVEYLVAADVAEQFEKMRATLDYVYERTCIDHEGEWTFKKPYDPQTVVDALCMWSEPLTST